MIEVEVVNEETKKESKWDGFKKKVKKALPWVCGIAGCIGTGILVHKIEKTDAECIEENGVARHIDRVVHKLQDGGCYAYKFEDEAGRETYAKVELCDKPEWWDDMTQNDPEVDTVILNYITSGSNK